MTEKPDLEQLKKQITEEYSKQNYKRVIELTDEVLKEDPKDNFALNHKFPAYYQYKLAASE